jgi:hypothetical protein
MKKLSFIALFTATFCLTLTQYSVAQSRSKGNSSPAAPVRVGSVTFNAGIGVGSEYKDDYYNSPFGIKAAIEWGLWHAGPGTVTLGVETGASFSNGGYYDDYRSHTGVIAMRSAWHCGWKVRGLDTYGGFSAGVGIHHYDYRNDSRYDFNQVIPVFGAFIGASYFVSPRFGFNAEAGYDITDFQAGVIFKLR